MRYIIVLLFVIQGLGAAAQQEFGGKIFKQGSNEVLHSVSIENRSRHHYNLSDQGGNFRIQAAAGDTLFFSSAGYQSDTLVLRADMFTGEYRVYLEPKVVALPSFRVGGLSNYQLDSMERRRDYDWVYSRSGNSPLINNKRQGDGVGMSMNLRTKSTQDRQIEKLKKRLVQEEEDYYIDSRFTREYVSRLTHLQGDSLQQFMVKYRPPYQFCRLATNTDILLWINDSIKKFRKREGTPGNKE